MKLKIFLLIFIKTFFLSFPLYGNSEDVTWGYTGKIGPNYWSSLDKNNFICSMGKRQSPIDITTSKTLFSKNLRKLFFNYVSSQLNIQNNGHTIEFDESSPGVLHHKHTIQAYLENTSSALLGGKDYNLLQFHFHSPSEHTVNGKSFSMEVHLVHQNDDGEIAVVALLVKTGKENTFLEKIFSVMPKTSGTIFKNSTRLNPHDMLPDDRSYYHYVGSLTTPPCTQLVEWYVLKTPITVSSKQLESFNKVYEGNNRPTQDIGTRSLLEK